MKLRDVIAKYERIADNLDDIVKTAHHEAFAGFSLELKNVARRALAGVEGVDPDKVDQWIETYAAKNAGAVMHFTLSTPDVSGGSASSAVEAFLNGEESSATGPAGVSASDVERWVRAGYERGSTDDIEGKNFDGRDQDVDSTVRKMIGILVYGNPAHDKIAAAQGKYGPIIREFMFRESQNDENQFNRFAAIIVLEAWVSHIRTRWPQYVLTELRRQVRS
jgi:hypothetical protein